MDENPYRSPEAPLDPPEAPEPGGRLLPWEEPSTGGALARAWATARDILRDPEEAGRRIAPSRAVGKAIAFFALAALPFQWAGQALAVAFTPLDGSGNEWFFKALHLPVPPPPGPEQMAFAKVMVWVGVAMAPLTFALGLLLSGLLAHAGLWMVKGLEGQRGLETTYRSILYAGGATAWVGFLNAFGVFLPRGIHPVHQLFSLALALGILTFQGMVLGHAHGLRPWRGVAAIFLPWVILGCCLGALLAPVMMGVAAGSH
ncbi:MAG TPA: YIP1 family protein [Holophagaceae bacterium]|nr:YIP1 family protein [Holophagaceae bacterium]